jgi:hypothetical protein
MFAEFALLREAGCKGIHMLHSKMSGAAKSRRVFSKVFECFEFELDGQRYGLPNVTVVIQVGPSPPELYVQRVGRSGRGGNKGKGILLP